MKSSNTGSIQEPEKRVSARVVIWAAFLTALVAVEGYFTMLTGFRTYDDEGSMMLAVKQYMRGMRLYEDVFSIYGPVYYFYNALIRRITFSPITHDVTRISSLIPWMVCCLVCGWITLRLTRSLVFAALNVTAISLTLYFFRAEPGHPQELTLLLLILLTACPVLFDVERHRPRLMAAMGLLAGLLLLVKVNIGVYIVAALALTILSECGESKVWRSLTYVVGAGCIVLPPALMANHLDAAWAQRYCFYSTVMIAAMVLAVVRVRTAGNLGLRDAALAVCCCVAAVAAAMTTLALDQVSIHTVIDSLVFLPARVFTRNRDWFTAPHFSWWLAPWAGAGLALALVFVWKKPEPGSRQAQRLFLVKAVFSVVALIAMPLRLDFLPLAGGFLWLVLFPVGPEKPGLRFARKALCSLTAMQSLYGYPVYGSQGIFVQCLLQTVVIVCAADSVKWLMAQDRNPKWILQHSRALATAALAAIVVFNCAICLRRIQNYAALPALDLPGARKLHLDSDFKQEFEQLTGGIRQYCDVFEGLPGLPSFNFWTQKDPVTGLSSDAWTEDLSPEQQTRIIRGLSEHPRACIIYNPELTKFWNRGNDDLGRLPLVAYIRRNFQPRIFAGDYQLMVRR